VWLLYKQGLNYIAYTDILRRATTTTLDAFVVGLADIDRKDYLLKNHKINS